MADTKIEWASHVWNPTTGCDRISAGCDHCYALTTAKRLKGMGAAKYQADGDARTSGPGFALTLHPDTLTDPFTWAKPRTVFVNSMSDLFHARVPLQFVQRVSEVIQATPQHTYQVLTKRAARLPKIAGKLPWPPNLWMGVSVENQEEADRRVPALLATPARVRFLSCEPLLGPVQASAWLPDLHWLITGGESGPGARPLDPAWVRDLIDQCRAAATAVFVKQLGTAWAQDTRVDGRSAAALGDRKGGDLTLWPADLAIRQFPAESGPRSSC